MRHHHTQNPGSVAHDEKRRIRQLRRSLLGEAPSWPYLGGDLLRWVQELEGQFSYLTLGQYLLMLGLMQMSLGPLQVRRSDVAALQLSSLNTSLEPLSVIVAVFGPAVLER